MILWSIFLLNENPLSKACVINFGKCFCKAWQHTHQISLFFCITPLDNVILLFILDHTVCFGQLILKKSVFRILLSICIHFTASNNKIRNILSCSFHFIYECLFSYISYVLCHSYYSRMMIIRRLMTYKHICSKGDHTWNRAIVLSQIGTHHN